MSNLPWLPIVFALALACWVLWAIWDARKRRQRMADARYPQMPPRESPPSPPPDMIALPVREQPARPPAGAHLNEPEPERTARFVAVTPESTRQRETLLEAASHALVDEPLHRWRSGSHDLPTSIDGPTPPEPETCRASDYSTSDTSSSSSGGGE